jgi:hypothetical protein
MDPLKRVLYVELTVKFSERTRRQETLSSKVERDGGRLARKASQAASSSVSKVLRNATFHVSPLAAAETRMDGSTQIAKRLGYDHGSKFRSVSKKFSPY